MKLLRKIFIGLSVAFLAICCGAVILFNWSATGLKSLTVPTGSMRPTIPPGSLVLMKSVPLSSLRVGDVITYNNLEKPGTTITHRIIKTSKLDGKVPMFVTQGDANPLPDKPVLGGLVKGKIVWHVPVAGTVLDTLKKPYILLPVLYLCAIIITFEELKRLSAYFKSKQPYIAAGYEPPKHPVTGKQRLAMGGKAASFAVVIALAIAIPARAALMSNTVSMGPNNISVAPIAASHLLVQQVIFEGDSSCVCVPGDGNISISVSNISGGSVSTISGSSSSCGHKIVNNTWVVVNNTNNQNKTTGNASGSGATSGNASNSNSTDINININNGGNSGHAVVIYNPTNAPVNLKNWTLTDDELTRKITGNKVIAAHGYFLLHWPNSGDGLGQTGDHMILKAPDASVVDGVSWGTDTTVLNPSVATTVDTTSIVRTPPQLDTDSATDWQALE